MPGVPRLRPSLTPRRWWATVGDALGARADDLLDLLLGSTCVGCDRPGRALCPSCARSFDGPAFMAQPDPAPPGLPPVWALAAYEGVVRSVLLAHKERGRTTFAAPLGAALSRVLAVTADSGDVAVLVPSRRTATRTRGYDPLARIARRAVTHSRRSGRSLQLCPALALARPVADQSGLDAAARSANLAGAMTVRRGFTAFLAGRTIVLLDDVVTTGATLAEAARAVRHAGGTVHAAAVVAATRRYTDSASFSRVSGRGWSG